MRVYIACLASHNAGIRHGAWIDLDGMDADDLSEEIAELLRRSPCPNAEEWAVHRYEDFPDLGERPSVERLVEVAEAISENGPAMHVWVACTGTVGGFEDAYYGTAESWEELAERLLEDSGELDEVPERLRRYIDLAAYARDLETDGWWAERGTDGQMHFFSE